MSNDKHQNKQQPIRINEEKGLQPAKNPPKMPTVKPPKAEKGI
jgi:hypothetical protein